MVMTDIHDAAVRLGELIDRVERGEEIIIARAGKPVARLIRYEVRRAPRAGGQWRGRVRMRDDFDAPIPPEVDRTFRGEGA